MEATTTGDAESIKYWGQASSHLIYLAIKNTFLKKYYKF